MIKIEEYNKRRKELRKEKIEIIRRRKREEISEKEYELEFFKIEKEKEKLFNQIDFY